MEVSKYGKVDTIHDFEWGTDISVENLSQGFTHCFLVTFKSDENHSRQKPWYETAEPQDAGFPADNRPS